MTSVIPPASGGRAVGGAEGEATGGGVWLLARLEVTKVELVDDFDLEWD